MTTPNYVPRGPISFLVGNRHVGTPDSEIEQEIRERIAGNNPNVTEEQIQACIDYALQCHHENRQLYVDVMSGNV